MKNFDLKFILIVIGFSIILSLSYTAYKQFIEKDKKYITLLPKKKEFVDDSKLGDANEEITVEDGEFLEVNFKQVEERIDNDNFLLIDARNYEDYSSGHIGNAINIHPYEEEDSYFEKIFTLPRDKKFIVYCTGGNCDLSHKVIEDMINAGHQNIFIYSAGWEEWIENFNEND